MSNCKAETFIGRLTIDIPHDIAKKLKFEQRIWEPSFLNAVSNLCTDLSYRKSADTANSFTRRKDNEKISERTLEDTIYREGRDISRHIEKIDRETLIEHGFDPETGKVLEDTILPRSIVKPMFSETETDAVAEKIARVIEDYNKTTENPQEQISWDKAIDRIESLPVDSIILCIDEVGVNQQAKTRKKENKQNPKSADKPNTNRKDARIGKKKVETAVVYLRSKEGNRRFAAKSITAVLIQALAYMLRMNLLDNRNLMIFTDGAKNLKDVVEKIFSFREHTINLDWFHLQKHCYEYFTMILAGGVDNKQRNESIRRKFEKMLFVGKVEEAKLYLDSIDSSIIKNHKRLEELKAYLDRKKNYIYIYAIRKGLKIVNSSNQGEKSNDMIVAQRCKHNGMSWAEDGVRGIYSIELLRLNGENHWFDKHEVTFLPVPHTAKIEQQYNTKIA